MHFFAITQHHHHGCVRLDLFQIIEILGVGLLRRSGPFPPLGRSRRSMGSALRARVARPNDGLINFRLVNCSGSGARPTAVESNPSFMLSACAPRGKFKLRGSIHWTGLRDYRASIGITVSQLFGARNATRHIGRISKMKAGKRISGSSRLPFDARCECIQRQRPQYVSAHARFHFTQSLRRRRDPLEIHACSHFAISALMSVFRTNSGVPDFTYSMSSSKEYVARSS